MRFVHPEVLEWLASGATVITPNRLVAAVIQRQFADRQLKSGQRTWVQPPVFSLPAWLQQNWRNARTRLGEGAPALLSADQEQLLWEQAIAESGVVVLDRAATARSAMNAARFLAEWELPVEHPAWGDEEDATKFQSWLRWVGQRCHDAGWVRGYDLIARVPEWFASAGLPSTIVFAGFTEVSKSVSRLVSRLRASGVNVVLAEANLESAGTLAIECSDPSQELEFAARWARARLEERPDVSIGIFVQNLRASRAAVQKTLRDVLLPASIVAAVSRSEKAAQIPFFIHSSVPLATYPIVANALALLEFSPPLIPIATVSAALCSPYIRGSEGERVQRAAADAKARRHRELELPLAAVEQETARCPEMRKIWPRLRKVLHAMPGGGAEPSDWTEFWRKVLEAFGWPGDTPLTRSESDVLEQWNELLSAFDSLGLTSQTFTAKSALTRLRAFAAKEGPSGGDLGCPIQVLEPQDAIPLQFDYTWLVGASELDWPPASFPPAYVPLSLLRGEGLGIATAAGRRDKARMLTAYVESSAKNVVVSYSSADASEATLSAFFSRSRAVKPADLHVWMKPTVLDQLGVVKLDEIEDTNGIPLPLDAVVPGGTHLLKSQSACPFQAYSRWRLNAESLDEGVFSYDARDRGSFLHDALANVWRDLQDSERLRAMHETELAELVSKAVSQAFSKENMSTTFRTQLRKAEDQRLFALIMDWLEVEKRRPGRFRARDVEKLDEFQLSRLMLKVRTDRIDETESGRLVVIDYKTGKVKREFLDDERPKEPQLLVYAAMLSEEIDGLYFASVRREKAAALGYGHQPYFGDRNEVVGDWDSQVRSWQNTVQQLAQEFETGRAAVDPLKKACDYCEIKPVCRIREKRADGFDGEAE